MAELEIIGAPFSNFVWTVRIAAAEKGVPYRLVPMAPHTPEVKAIHPLGRIPVMRHGDVALCESRAIIAYIDRAFAGPALFPADAAAAATVEQWIGLVCTGTDAVCMRQYGIAYFFPGTPDGKPDPDRIAAAVPKMEKALRLVDRQVAKAGHLAGAEFSLADAYLVPVLHWMTQLPESAAAMAALPNLTAYFQRLMQRPSVDGAKPPPRPQK